MEILPLFGVGLFAAGTALLTLSLYDFMRHRRPEAQPAPRPSLLAALGLDPDRLEAYRDEERADRSAVVGAEMIRGVAPNRDQSLYFTFSSQPHRHA